MSALPLFKVVAPVIAKVPLSVIAWFVAVKPAVPLIVEAAKSIAAFSVIATFAPVIANAPKVDADSSKVMLLAPALRVVAPAIAKVPLSVIAPPASADKLAAVKALRSKAVVSTIVTALPESVVKVTLPV